MKKSFLLIVFAVLAASGFAQVKVIKFPELQRIMNVENDSVYVVNFWATWCNPCVKEIPYFEKLRQSYADKKLSIVLLSLDFRKDAVTRVQGHITKNKIKNRVLLLDETDYNSWIDKVDSAWSGAIPATIVCKRNYKKFYEREFESYSDLENIVKPLIQ